jgi:HTH-type transcriptional regulator/antitoxin HigA
MMELYGNPYLMEIWYNKTTIRESKMIIKNKTQYKKCIKEYSKAFKKYVLLQAAIKRYDDKHYHFKAPSAVEFIKFRMENMGLKQRDLIPYIGSKSKVSEVLSGRISLSIKMIKALHTHLEIPLSILLEVNKD